MEWKEVVVADRLRVSLPDFMERADAQGADTTVVAFVGDDVTVTVDHGLFSDPLTRHADQADHHLIEATIGGLPARVVSFTEADGTRFVGAHFPDAPGPGGDAGRLTLVARAGPGVDAEFPRRIVESVEFSGEEGRTK